jgi:hypothetical protein
MMKADPHRASAKILLCWSHKGDTYESDSLIPAKFEGANLLNHNSTLVRDLKKMFRFGTQNDFATLSATSGLSHWKMSEQSCSESDLPLAYVSI